jgi:anthranilate synthase component 1
METMNKLAANLRCIELAEQYYGENLGSKSVQEIIEDERQKGDEFYKLQTMSAGA